MITLDDWLNGSAEYMAAIQKWQKTDADFFAQEISDEEKTLIKAMVAEHNLKNVGKLYRLSKNKKEQLALEHATLIKVGGIRSKVIDLLHNVTDEITEESK